MKFDYSQVPIPKEYKNAFKDADIRGLFETEINSAVAYRVAMIFVQLFDLQEVIVARDMRESSPALHAAFVSGVMDAGAQVIDIGLAETPALYFASGKYNAAGVMITASHNPKEYNGLKLVTAGAVPVTNKTGLATIKQALREDLPRPAAVRGKRTRKNILREYVRYVSGRVPLPRTQKPIRIVIDAGNGMASLAINQLSSKLPVTVTPLFYELDGTFPNRESNPTLAKNQKAIIAALKEGDYDFGVAFDGDADRLAFFDETGTYINSAQIGALLAQKMLEDDPRSAFIYTVFTSRRYQETIEACGGKAFKARVGHAFIKEKMHEHDAVFACEHSAHFYFKDNYYADSGILVLLHLLRAYSEVTIQGLRFSDMIQPYTNYFQTEEVLVAVSDKNAAINTIVNEYTGQPSYTVKQFDGVSVQHPEYWFTVKKSVTEDALKFVVESPDKALAKRKQKALQALLQSL